MEEDRKRAADDGDSQGDNRKRQAVNVNVSLDDDNQIVDNLKSEFITFPDKLMMLLDDDENTHSQKFLRWNLDGDAILLLKDGFFENILQKHFHGLRFESFTKKLNRWGFKRLVMTTLPSNSIAFHHGKFLRGRRDLLVQLRCRASGHSQIDHQSDTAKIQQQGNQKMKFQIAQSTSSYLKDRPINEKSTEAKSSSRSDTQNMHANAPRFASMHHNINDPVPRLEIGQNFNTLAQGIILDQSSEQTTESLMEIVRYHSERQTLEGFTLELLQQNQRAAAYMTAAQHILESLITTQVLRNPNNSNNNNIYRDDQRRRENSLQPNPELAEFIAPSNNNRESDAMDRDDNTNIPREIHFANNNGNTEVDAEKGNSSNRNKSPTNR